MNAVAHAAALFGRHKDALGFVMTNSLAVAEARDELFVTASGAAYVRHRLDKTTTIHAICSEQPGHGSRLLRLIIADCRARGQTHLLAKCPAELAANAWYARRGFVSIDTDPGKRRALTIWRLDLCG